MPMQNGDCWNYCPTQCCKDSVMCPGKMDPKGCNNLISATMANFVLLIVTGK